MTSHNQGLIRDIEVLRAVAVLAVVVQHMENLIPRHTIHPWIASVMTGGWAGVDLFFAISGYVITKSFFSRNLDDQAPSWRPAVFKFWIGRIFRLLPSAWMWLFILLLASIFFNESGVFGTVKNNLIWTAGGMFNFSNILMVHYFTVETPGASFVYWSLSLEEQFYLLFPFLALLLRKNLLWLAIVAIVLQFNEIRSLWGWMFRTDAIAFGVIIAILQMSGKLPKVTDRIDKRLALIAVTGLLAILFFSASRSQELIPYLLSLVALLSALILVPCSENADIFARAGWLGKLFLWIGKRSYAIYLIHIPVYFTLRELGFRLGWKFGAYPVLSFTGALLLILALAELNYRFLELPLRQKGREISARINVQALRSS